MQNGIKQIILSVGAVITALIIVMSVFSGGGNLLGGLFIYFAPIAVIFAVFRPTHGLIALIISSTFMDTIKRVMIIDGHLSRTDIAAIQMFCPAFGLGIIIACFSKIFVGKEQKNKVVIFIVAQLVGILLGVAFLLKQDISLSGFGDFINAYTYIAVAGCLPLIYSHREEINKVFKCLVICYILVALWAISQGIWGIYNFELEYLLSGFTVESRQLNERVFRNMGTLASAPAMSYTASILAAAMIIPFNYRDGKNSLLASMHPFRLAGFAIFATAAFYTYTRTGWIVGIIAIALYLILSKRWMVYFAFCAALVSMISIIIFAEQIVDSRALNVIQDEVIRTELSDSETLDQVMVLGTVNGRLESLANLTSNTEIWTPFGVKLAGREYLWEDIYAHDLLTESLMMLGYVPMMIISILGLFFIIKFYHIYLNMYDSREKNTLRLFSSLGIAMTLVSLGQMKAAFVFPVNMFWGCFLGFAAVCWVEYKNKLKEGSHEVGE